MKSYIRDHANVDIAQCSSIVYDPKVFKGVMVHDENTETLSVCSSDSEYFHPDFHSSMNMGIDYIAKEHGVEHLQKYLATYTVNVYKPVIDNIKTVGAFDAIEQNIKNTYKLEKAEHILHIERSENSLVVTVDYCPAVKHLHNTGRDVSDWFEYSTKTVMQTLADIGNVNYEFISYDKKTGKAKYRFYN